MITLITLGELFCDSGSDNEGSENKLNIWDWESQGFLKELKQREIPLESLDIQLFNPNNPNNPEITFNNCQDKPNDSPDNPDNPENEDEKHIERAKVVQINLVNNPSNPSNPGTPIRRGLTVDEDKKHRAGLERMMQLQVTLITLLAIEHTYISSLMMTLK